MKEEGRKGEGGRVREVGRKGVGEGRSGCVARVKEGGRVKEVG